VTLIGIASLDLSVAVTTVDNSIRVHNLVLTAVFLDLDVMVAQPLGVAAHHPEDVVWGREIVISMVTVRLG